MSEIKIRRPNLVILDDPRTDAPVDREKVNRWYEEMRLRQDVPRAKILRGPEKPPFKHGAWPVLCG